MKIWQRKMYLAYRNGQDIHWVTATKKPLLTLYFKKKMIQKCTNITTIQAMVWHILSKWIHFSYLFTMQFKLVFTWNQKVKMLFTSFTGLDLQHNRNFMISNCIYLDIHFFTDPKTYKEIKNHTDWYTADTTQTCLPP